MASLLGDCSDLVMSAPLETRKEHLEMYTRTFRDSCYYLSEHVNMTFASPARLTLGR